MPHHDPLVFDHSSAAHAKFSEAEPSGRGELATCILKSNHHSIVRRCRYPWGPGANHPN